LLSGIAKCFRSAELNLNSRLVVIFVLRLAKPLSENTMRNRSAKVKVTHCSENKHSTWRRKFLRRGSENSEQSTRLTAAA